MGKRHRPVFNQAFGNFLVELRGKASQRSIVALAERRGLPLTYQTLRDLEEGKIKHPDPRALDSLAKLYAKTTTYAELVQRYVTGVYQSAVTIPDTPSSNSGLETHHALTAQVGVLTEQRNDAIAALENVLTDLQRIVERHRASGHAHGTSSHKAGVRRRAASHG